jgi:hypothetical protein
VEECEKEERRINCGKLRKALKRNTDNAKK